MLDDLISWILGLIETNSALSVFLGVLLEQIIVPIPSPLVLIAAGFILTEPGSPVLDTLNRIIFKIVVPASFGSVIGALFVYGIAYYGGKPLIQKLGRFLDVSWNTVEKMQGMLEKGHRVEISIFALRAVPVIPLSLVSVACGAIRVDWKTFLVFTFLGTVPRALLLTVVGWRVREAYTSVASSVDFLETLVSIATVLSLLALLLYLYSKRRKAGF